MKRTHITMRNIDKKYNMAGRNENMPYINATIIAPPEP